MASCEIPDKNAKFGPLHFPKNVDVNDEVPSQKTLDKIADYPLFDVNGKPVPFKLVCEGTNGEKKNHKVLVIFIRHFYCGSCQDYIMYICKGLPSPTELDGLSKPVSVIIVGCGEPSLIPFYAETTSCSFPIYADPTRHLYSVLQMTTSIGPSKRPSEYVKDNNVFSGFTRAVSQALSRVVHGDALKGGSPNQVGGEFLFEDGKVAWCHRMRDVADHTDLSKIRELLGLPVSEGAGEGLAGMKST